MYTSLRMKGTRHSYDAGREARTERIHQRDGEAGCTLVVAGEAGSLSRGDTLYAAQAA